MKIQLMSKTSVIQIPSHNLLQEVPDRAAISAKPNVLLDVQRLSFLFPTFQPVKQISS